jgi:hypothetical protein
MADTVLVVLELGSWLGPRAGLADTVASEEHEVVMAVGANFDQLSRSALEGGTQSGILRRVWSSRQGALMRYPSGCPQCFSPFVSVGQASGSGYSCGAISWRDGACITRNTPATRDVSFAAHGCWTGAMRTSENT